MFVIYLLVSLGEYPRVVERTIFIFGQPCKGKHTVMFANFVKTIVVFECFLYIIVKI